MLGHRLEELVCVRGQGAVEGTLKHHNVINKLITNEKIVCLRGQGVEIGTLKTLLITKLLEMFV